MHITRRTGGFRRTQLKGKMLACIGPPRTASIVIATETARNGQARADHSGHCYTAMLCCCNKGPHGANGGCCARGLGVPVVQHEGEVAVLACSLDAFRLPSPLRGEVEFTQRLFVSLIFPCDGRKMRQRKFALSRQ